MAEEEATGPKELKEMAGNQSEDDEGNGEENIEVSIVNFFPSTVIFLFKYSSQF